MKTINIRDNTKNLKNILYEKLQNKIFHITSQIGYEGIIRDNAIYPSNHKNIKSHIWSFSEFGRYFTNINCVSVVDFYNNKDKKLIDEAIKKYRYYDMTLSARGKIGYIFIIKNETYKNVISWIQIKEDWYKNPGQQIVPNLESGVKNKILLSDIDYIIKVETIN